MNSKIVFAIVVLVVGAFGQDCVSDLEVGLCRASFEFYGYDTNQKQCVMFIYGGCFGNENRYDTLEECQAACET